MTTSAVPPHASRARYRGGAGWPPCRCADCRRGESRHRKLQRHQRTAGHTGFVDVEPVAVHLELLRAGGASLEAVAAAARCSSSTLHYVLGDRQARMRRAIADRVRAVELADVINTRRPVPSLGPSRRLRALYAVGHGLNDIASSTGLTRQFLASVVSRKKPTISLDAAERIDACWQALKGLEGDCARNRHRAVREGRAPPSAWIDDDLDAPEAEPARGAHAAARERAAEIRYLGAYGISPEEIARRVGGDKELTFGYVAQQLSGYRAPGWRDRESA